MKNLLFVLLMLPGACQKSNIPVPGSETVQERGGCESTVIVKTIQGALFTVTRIGETWCLNSAANDERLIPCDWNWDPELQVVGKKVLLSGNYPEWKPSPNVRYMGRPFIVEKMVKE